MNPVFAPVTDDYGSGTAQLSPFRSLQTRDRHRHSRGGVGYGGVPVRWEVQEGHIAERTVARPGGQNDELLVDRRCKPVD